MPCVEVLVMKGRERVDGCRRHTRSRSVAAMILHPSFSPKPTMLSLDLGEISSMTCSSFPEHQHTINRATRETRTCAAYRNALRFSQSLSISASSSERFSFPFTHPRAAAICSERIKSTVLLKVDTSLACWSASRSAM